MGTRLQEARRKTLLTQKEVAEKIGISQRTYEYYEQGYKRIDGAKLTTLCRISNVLQCRIEDILEEEESITAYRQRYE